MQALISRPTHVANFCFRLLTTIAIGAFVILSGGAPAHAQFGGKGDFQETYNCPAGQFLTGFHGRTGLWIDQIGLVCARFAQPAYSVGSSVKLPPRGGTGGGPNKQICDADSAIRSAYVRLTNDFKRVAYIKLSCFRPRDGSFAGGRIYGGPDPGTPNHNITPIGPFIGNDPYEFTDQCHSSDYAIGLQVNYGRDVNAVGLICAPFSSEGIAPPPPRHPTASGPIVHLGKGPHTTATPCLTGFVWREASRGDYVCVPPERRDQAAADNAAAASRTNPNGAFGPQTCIQGYVWREANPGDRVCVTPQSRASTQQENASALSRAQ